MPIAPFGLGQNQRQSNGFGAAQGYDPSRTQYGGSETYASDERLRLAAEAKAADARKANALDPSQMNQSREGQSDALALMRARATNTDPNASVAGKQMNAGLARVMAANQSAGASARGPAGLALAQQQSAANTANAMQQTSADAGAAAAQEASQNLNAWSGATTNQRGQDFDLANANAGFEARQRALNDARWQAAEGMRAHVSDEQMRGGMTQQQQQLQGSMTQEELENKRAQANAGNEMDWFGKWTGAANQVGGAAKGIFSDVRTKEGTTMLDGSRPPRLAPGTEDYERTQPKPAPEEPSALSRAMGGFSRGLIPSAAQLNAEAAEAQANRPLYAAPPPREWPWTNSPIESKDFVSMPGGPATFDKLNASGGLDVMGSLGAHNAAAMQYAENAGSGPTMMSPGEAKDFESLPTSGDGRSALARAIDEAHARDNAAATPSDYEVDQGGKVTRPNTRILDERGHITPEFIAEARAQLAAGPGKADYEVDERRPVDFEVDDEPVKVGELDQPAPKPGAAPRQGGAINPAMEQYLASTAPSAYRYKPEYQGHPGSAPGVNIGPASAQAIRATPVGATMIEKDPETGMLGINKDKALKTTMSATSYVNRKVDNLARAMSEAPRAPQRPAVVHEYQELPPEMIYSRDPQGRVTAHVAPAHLRRR